MVPSAILVLFASTLLAKNVCQAGFRPQMSEEKVMTLSRFMVLVIMAFALVFAIFFPNELVPLLIFGYNGVSQFFPGVVLGLFWKRVTKPGVFYGMAAGVIVVIILILSKNDPFLGMNAGFVGLVVNMLTTVLVSLKTKPSAGGLR
jgi:SSS family solute:Na+ symporter